MTLSRQPENIKICPECGTNLIHTAKHCAVCGYRFVDAAAAPVEEGSRKKWPYQQQTSGSTGRRGPRPVMINLPILFGLMILFLAANVLLTLGLQKRDQTKATVDAVHTTSTYVATTYVSPTPSPTETRTPAPPTETPEVEVQYTVVEGDSCLSIAKKFNLYLDSLLKKNDIDCSVLKVGTVLTIPNPTPTPEPTTGQATNTPVGTKAP